MYLDGSIDIEIAPIDGQSVIETKSVASGVRVTVVRSDTVPGHGRYVILKRWDAIQVGFRMIRQAIFG